MWWSGVHEVRVDKLFDVGAHFGHLIRFSNRKMLPYIYGSVAGMGILDLHKTVSCFNLASTHSAVRKDNQSLPCKRALANLEQLLSPYYFQKYNNRFREFPLDSFADGEPASLS